MTIWQGHMFNVANLPGLLWPLICISDHTRQSFVSISISIAVWTVLTMMMMGMMLIFECWCFLDAGSWQRNADDENLRSWPPLLGNGWMVWGKFSFLFLCGLFETLCCKRTFALHEARWNFLMGKAHGISDGLKLYETFAFCVCKLMREFCMKLYENLWWGKFWLGISVDEALRQTWWNCMTETMLAWNFSWHESYMKLYEILW